MLVIITFVYWEEILVSFYDKFSLLCVRSLKFESISFLYLLKRNLLLIVNIHGWITLRVILDIICGVCHSIWLQFIQSAFLHYTLVPLTDEHSSISEPALSMSVQHHVLSLAWIVFKTWCPSNFVFGIQPREEVWTEWIFWWSAIFHWRKWKTHCAFILAHEGTAIKKSIVKDS